MQRYVRDMRGYGQYTKDPAWPNGANIAVQFVINYEEGGENCLLHGDEQSEAFLSEIIGASNWPNQRHWNMESIYEYGARAGFWRLHRIFTQAQVPVTVFGVATALARSPDQVEAMKQADWEIASHGLKWIEYKDFTPAQERAHIERAIELHTQVTGERPRGFYQGRASINSVAIAASEGGFDYVSDIYSDDLPYWMEINGKAQLAIPYTLDTNDMRFATAQGFNNGDQFYSYLKDSFDMLLQEGENGSPKMLSIGLHCRLAGRPGRARALQRFIDYINSHDKVWLARRIDIANHWMVRHPLMRHNKLQPSTMGLDEFIEKFGSIFEHSPWIAKRAFELELGAAHDSAGGLHNALARVFRSSDMDERLRVLKAHPDLAGKLAAAKRLTSESTAEQSSAQLDCLTDLERTQFTKLNSAYMEKFGFPFIIAVKDHTKATILEQFKTRLENSADVEFNAACKQVERIAYLRLKDILPT